MLLSLNIKNVVLIDQLTIVFKQGLCALTGETGAGKSILLDSLGLALGMRGQSGLIRRGEDQASVTAIFQMPKTHAAYKILSKSDIEIDDDLLLMRRVLYPSGKSRAYINDQPVSIALLKQVGDSLVEIHGQFETQGLLNPSTHRAMLDEYANINGDLSSIWHEWKAQEIELYNLQELSRRAHDDEEYLRASLDDLSGLSPNQGEEEELSSLRSRLKYRENMLEALSIASEVLGAENDPVQKAWAELDKISDKVGDDLEPAISALSRASSEIAEASALINDLSVTLQESDANLEEIDDRLYALRLQARKHDCTVDELPNILEQLSRQLSMIENSDEELLKQSQICEQLRSKYIEKSAKISDKRKSTAQKLDRLVQKELAPLKLEKARFVTNIETLDEVDWGEHGTDRVRFLISTNQGSELGAINKIASGGELARFILALKVIIASSGSTHSFIFDEVDTGLGGATADAVGERLARLANEKQVLVVTHSPQVAARASNHWIVSKSGRKQVKTDIILLETREARREEIARMLAGADITLEARAAADKLLQNAN